MQDWRAIPSVPTAAFKELELTSIAPLDRSASFVSSGTTDRDRSRHFHSAASLALYEESLLPWFERHLLGDLGDLVDEQMLGPLDQMPMLFLTPDKEAAPNSSLVHMFDVIGRKLGARDSLFAGRLIEGRWTLDMDRTLFAIRKSMCANRPLMLLGTAFNFVHLLDHFSSHNMRYRLAHGSRVVETGGYKGQSREIPRDELCGMISRHLGVPRNCIVTEYGMCELGSQAYDGVARAQEARFFRFPPWTRAQVISPETGAEVAGGETGLLRIFDLANVYSVLAIQTEDLAVKREAGFELFGRAPRAQARGCSLFAAT